MGLGKTLQALCIILSDHLERREKYQQTHSVEFTPLPSLIIWYLLFVISSFITCFTKLKKRSQLLHDLVPLR